MPEDDDDPEWPHWKRRDVGNCAFCWAASWGPHKPECYPRQAAYHRKCFNECMANAEDHLKISKQHSKDAKTQIGLAKHYESLPNDKQ